MFKNHPKGLLTAALSNMGERFGYYIMNAVLVLFLCSKFGLSEAASGTIYSFFYAGIYILSLVGGLIADRTQNYKGTIKTGLVVMATAESNRLPIANTDRWKSGSGKGVIMLRGQWLCGWRLSGMKMYMSWISRKEYGNGISRV